MMRSARLIGSTTTVSDCQNFFCSHCSMESSVNFQLLFKDEDHQTHDLLRKLKGDCIKEMDDAPYKKVLSKLESLVDELYGYFPVLSSAVGTLSFKVCYPVTGCLCAQPEEPEEKEEAAASCSKPAGRPVVENPPNNLSCTAKLGALKINPRPGADETAIAPDAVVQCVDLRSALASPVDASITPPCLERRHFQVSQTPTPSCHSGSYVDLGPSPLPLPDQLEDSLFETVTSPAIWETETTLGSGGGGTVSLHPCPKWAVAVKRVRMLKSEDREDIEREAVIMKSLHHPNIVGYFGSRFVGDYFNIMIEWMPGRSLKDWMRQFGPFRDKELIEYSHQLLSGLSYLHDNNIVHRDIKGDNLFIGYGNQLKIGDFGHAQYMVDGVVSCEEKLEGTVLYMAPEYVRTLKFMPSCDVWSAGCVMVEMATGDPPWPQWAERELCFLIYQVGAASRPPCIPAFLSPPVRDLISSCLQLDPNRRGSAHDLLAHRVFAGLQKSRQLDPPAPVSDLPSIGVALDSLGSY